VLVLMIQIMRSILQEGKTFFEVLDEQVKNLLTGTTEAEDCDQIQLAHAAQLKECSRVLKEFLVRKIEVVS
jgi:hypothetical protein